MAKKDARVDAYIAKAAEFARPILSHIRQVVHETCPQVEETFKWSFPCFLYKGMFCSMAAFKSHCSFGFWKHRLLFPTEKDGEGMGQFGRLTSLSDLPKDGVMRNYLKKAMRLNDEGQKVVRPVSRRPKPVVVPEFLRDALHKNKAALRTFESFSPSHKREYVEWLTEAKREETRNKRLSTALKWLAEGKLRNWKYMNC